MKTLNYFSGLFLSILILFSSCRSEETITIDPPAKSTIKVNSKAAKLMSRIALKDGSIDNIIDKANCLTVKLPVTVTANGNTLIINEENDYGLIEEIFDELRSDQDSITIHYPIDVIFSDYTVKTVHSDTELMALSKECNDEDEEDDDIECIDFEFPLEISSFNVNSELATSIIIEDDNQLYNFIDQINNDNVVSLIFPVNLIEANGVVTEVESIAILEETIKNAENSCDEDDDNDYNDDDCNECSVQNLGVLFDTNYAFNVSYFKVGSNVTDEYSNFSFYFDPYGSIIQNTRSGTWKAIGEGNNMLFLINLPGLIDFNGTWNLVETKISLEKVSFTIKNEKNMLEFSRPR